MEERIENVGEGNRGASAETTLPRVASGIHSEDSVIEIPNLPNLPNCKVTPNPKVFRMNPKSGNPSTPSLPPKEFRNSPRG